jgi:hypothetical protein
VLTSRLSAGKAYRSLQFAIRWGTGKSHGKLTPMDGMNFDNDGPVPPVLDPQASFTTLDETLVFFGTEVADPPSRAKVNMPFMLAGGDGKVVRTGRWINCGGVPHNKLLTSIFNVFGDSRTGFGDSRVESTPLTTATLT